MPQIGTASTKGPTRLRAMPARIGVIVRMLLAMLSLASLATSAVAVPGVPDRLRIYVDADMTHSATVGRTIELAIRTALAVEGRAEDFAIIARDHRGNPRRSLDTLAMAAADPAALVVFGGMHSPPYLVFGDRMNALGIPILLPWSAGGAITRQAETPRNLMFRVSVDDVRAAGALVGHAREQGCRMPAIVALENVWGRANAAAMEAALAVARVPSAGTWTAPRAASRHHTASITDALMRNDADCILVVGDPKLTYEIVHHQAEQVLPLPVISHWGVLGQDVILDRLRVPLARVSLAILGSCGLERLDRHAELADRAEAAASRIAGRSIRLSDLIAPHAFFHAYDATVLMLRAADLARVDGLWDGGPDARREALRRALYRLDEPVEGFLKRYDRPFRPVIAWDRDGHEALGAADLCFARLDAMGRLRPLDRGEAPSERDVQ